jgi:hypothetical protein
MTIKSTDFEIFVCDILSEINNFNAMINIYEKRREQSEDKAECEYYFGIMVGLRNAVGRLKYIINKQYKNIEI